MSNLYTSDFHLGDDRFKLMRRPFNNTEEAAEIMLSNLREQIDSGTTLYVLGDLALNEKWLDMFNEYTSKAKQRILVKGNYDTLDDETYIKFFQLVVRDYLDHTIVVNGTTIPIRLHHYPSQFSVSKRFSLCGHIHSAWKVQKNMLNAGVDVHHFYPINDEDISFYINAIKNFYDQDVWVENHPSNAYHSKRGKEGTYWKNNYSGSAFEVK